MKHFFLALFLLFSLVLTGCAKQAVSFTNGEPLPLSSEAEAIYSYLAAHIFFAEGNLTTAAASLEKAWNLHPTKQTTLELSSLYWQTQNYDKAERILQDAHQKAPESFRLTIGLAKALAIQGHFEQAIALLEAYRQKHPHRLDIQHEIALYRLEQGQPEKAIGQLQQIPAQKRAPLTYFLLGKAYTGMQRFGRARHFFRMTLTRNPHFFDAKVEIGLAYEAEKNYVQAEKIFGELLDNDNANPQLILHLVDLSLKLNKPDQALFYVRQAPQDPGLFLEAAELFLQQHFYAHAWRLLRPLAETRPIPTDALFPLALLSYEEKAQLSQADEYLAQIPQNSLQYERALLFRLHIALQQEKYAKALKLCEEGLEHFPDTLDFHLMLADLYEHNKDYARSMHILKGVQKRWPQNTQVLYYIGMLQERQGQRQKALQTMEKLLILDSEHAEALNYVGYTFAEENRNLDRALTLIQTALAVEPENGYFLDSLAWVYFRQKRYDAAWLEISRAVVFVSSDPTIWEHYGDIAKVKGFYGEARKAYAESLSLKANQEHVRQKLQTLSKP